MSAPVFTDIGYTQAICPSCHVGLKKFPARKAVCSECGAIMFVRTRPSDRKNVLVNDTTRAHLEAEWDSYHRFQEMVRLEWLYADDELVAASRASLDVQNESGPALTDVLLLALGQRADIELANENLGLHRNARLSLGQVHEYLGQTASAAGHFAAVLYLDINNATNFERKSWPRWIKPDLAARMQMFRPNEGDLLPFVLTRFIRCAHLLDLQSDFLDGLVREAIQIYAVLDPPISPSAFLGRLSEELRRKTEVRLAGGGNE